MLRNLFQALFGIFSRKQKQREAEHALIVRMTEQAQEIASGEYITKSSLPKPVVPERRKNPR